MNKFLIALTAAAAAAVCSSSQAAIVATVTPVAITAAGFTGYTGYKITMTSATGVIGGLDFSGAKAIQLPLHQRWGITFDENGVPTINPSPTSATLLSGVDSHFYIPATVSPATTVEPSEDNLGVGSPSAPGVTHQSGLGTTMGGAWSYIVDATHTGGTASMDIAYLVIKDTSMPANGILATPYVTEVVGGTVIPKVPVQISVVPEPTSLGFLVLTGAGLIARRRKA